MKAFIKNTILYISLMLGIFVFIDLLTGYTLSKRAKFKISSNPKYIIVGHSHPESAYDDTLISNFKNIAESGESYYFTYIKIKKILEQNNSIETIFIEFTNNQVHLLMDNWIWDEKHISYRYPRYSAFIPISDQLLLLKNNPREFVNSISVSEKTKIIKLVSNEIDYSKQIGGYVYLVRDKTDSLVKSIHNPKTKNEINTQNADSISEANLLYLSKTVQLIKSYHKKVVFVRSPQHKLYSGYANERAYKQILASRFSEIPYLDFTKLFFENYEYGDLEHLNYKGSKRFSKWFNDLLVGGLFSQNDMVNYLNQKVQDENAKQVSLN
jgi:hypothetical protein